MIVITATELKENLGKYLKIAEKERINVTRNGKLITSMMPQRKEAKYQEVKSVTELFGIIPADADIDIDKARWEHLKKKCGY